MLILTGMDNSGKTTLAEQLSEQLGRPVMKSLGPNATQSEKDVWLLDQMTREKAYPDSVIFDRFLPLEEIVYGNVLRGGSQYTLDDYYMTQLKELHPTIIYTRPWSGTIFNFGERGQMDGVIEQKEKLLQAWDDLMWGMMARGWDVRIYDYTANQEVSV